MANLLKPETSWGKRSVRTQGINKHGKRKMTKLNIEIAKRKLTRAANMARERFSDRELSDREFLIRNFLVGNLRAGDFPIGNFPKNIINLKG